MSSSSGRFPTYPRKCSSISPCLDVLKMVWLPLAIDGTRISFVNALLVCSFVSVGERWSTVFCWFTCLVSCLQSVLMHRPLNNLVHPAEKENVLNLKNDLHSLPTNLSADNANMTLQLAVHWGAIIIIQTR